MPAGDFQERLWALEDEINGLRTVSYNAEGICERMAHMVRQFPNLDDGDRKLWAESWIADVQVKSKEAAVALTPPLCSLGFLSPSPAPRREKPQAPELRIRVVYDLTRYYQAAAGRAVGPSVGPTSTYGLPPGDDVEASPEVQGCAATRP